jgi:hypothetical protein
LASSSLYPFVQNAVFEKRSDGKEEKRGERREDADGKRGEEGRMTGFGGASIRSQRNLFFDAPPLRMKEEKLFRGREGEKLPATAAVTWPMSCLSDRDFHVIKSHLSAAFFLLSIPPSRSSPFFLSLNGKVGLHSTLFWPTQPGAAGTLR